MYEITEIIVSVWASVRHQRGMCVCASPIFEAPHVSGASTPAQKGRSPEKQGIVRFSMHFLF